MVFKGHGPLSFTLFPRLGFGSSHKSDSSSHPRNAGRREDDWYIPYNGPYEVPTVLNSGKAQGSGHINVATDNTRLSNPQDDVHTGPTMLRATPRPRAQSAMAHPPVPVLVIPNVDGGIGESPIPLHRSPAPPVPPKRSSRMGFFAFSSGRKSHHGSPIIQMPSSQQLEGSDPNALLPMPGGWPTDKARRYQAQLADPTTVPSSLRTEDEDYYYTYYSTLLPSPASPPSRPPGVNTANLPLFKRSPSRHRDRNGNLDPDSLQSSPVEFYSLTNTQTQHPYAYSSSLLPQPQHQTTSSEPLPLRHIASQQIHYRDHDAVLDANILHPSLGRRSPEAGARAVGDVSVLQQRPPLTPLRASMSVPNLSSTAAVDSRPIVGTRTTAPVPRNKHRWFTAETWCDAVLFPRPRFKVEEGKYTRRGEHIISPPVTPIEGHVAGNSSSRPFAVLTGRPRAASATVNGARMRRVLTKSRSAADLLLGPTNSATSHVGVESTLEPQIEEQPLTESAVEQVQLELSSTTPPPSLTQVLEEGELLTRQREQWRSQAAKSLGNRHARSMSRARSKSLSDKQAGKSSHSKGESNFDFLVARTLLGSQSVTPTVHITRSTSLHSKSYSHSHSHSRTHTNLSHTYSHGHSHSMSTSHSSKSSRNVHNHGHSRSESWGKAALLKASSLCGAHSNDSPTTPVDGHAMSSRAEGSRVLDLRAHSQDGGMDDGNAVRKGVSPSPSVPSGEGVGIAISSPGPMDQDTEGFSMPGHPYAHDPSYSRHQETNDEARRASKCTHKSSEYAGPHPSTVDPNLSAPIVISDVSLRHRLPPRAAVHVPHPYASALAQSEEQFIRPRALTDATPSLPMAAAALSVERGFNPHISISNPDFERYGVGEALVYASLPKPHDDIRTKDDRNVWLVKPERAPPETDEAQTSAVGEDNSKERSPSPPVAERRGSSRGQSPCSQLDTSSAMLERTASARMTMASFGSTDDLEEFKDLFYKPPAPSSPGSQLLESGFVSKGIPSDVQSSRSSASALTNLVRSLSDEITELKNSSRILTDTIHQSSRSGRHATLSGSESNHTVLDSALLPPSPSAMELLLHSPVEQGGVEAEVGMKVTEDLISSSESLVLEAPTLDENDTFGYPIKSGPVEAVPPSPIQTPRHPSTHVSILEGEEDPTDLPGPMARSPPSNVGHLEVLRSSYMTSASENSRMSGLSDFPLPPTTHPDLVHRHTRTSFEATPLSTDDTAPSESSLPVSRATTQVTGYVSNRMTFGGNEDIEIDLEVHNSTP